METTDLSINGYYLRPTLSYKASTIFGADPALAKLAEAEAVGGAQEQSEAMASFASLLAQGVATVNDMQLASSDIKAEFAAGLTDNIHEVLITGEKASTSLQLAMAIRTKVLDAYSEIMRMQL